VFVPSQLTTHRPDVPLPPKSEHPGIFIAVFPFLITLLLTVYGSWTSGTVACRWLAAFRAVCIMLWLRSAKPVSGEVDIARDRKNCFCRRLQMLGQELFAVIEQAVHSIMQLS